MSDDVKIVVMPKLGESILDAKIVTWFKKQGDIIKKDEALLEVTTDKVTTEVPSPYEGIIQEILAVEGETVDIEKPICKIGEKSHSQPSATTSFFSPRILQMAKENNLSIDQLRSIKGTGDHHRVTSKDVKEYLISRAQQPQLATQTIAQEVQLSNARKMISTNLEKSVREIPHAYLICPVNVSAIFRKVDAHKKDFSTRLGVKLTVNAYFILALIETLKKFPTFHGKLMNGFLQIQEHIHLGIAVNVDGGVIVPVLKKADTYSFETLCQKVQDLIERAKKHALSSEELTGGNFTITNFGMSGIEIGLPIIRYPESGILAIGTIKREVVVGKEDAIEIVPRASVTLAFDHRIRDGMDAGHFLQEFRKCIENPF